MAKTAKATASQPISSQSAEVSKALALIHEAIQRNDKMHEEAAYAGIEEFEGNEFGLSQHKAYGAMHIGEIAGEQKLADDNAQETSENAAEQANHGQRRSRANRMANCWICAAIAFWGWATSIVSFFVFVGTRENAKESVMNGGNGVCAGVRGIIGALTNTLLDNVQGLGLVSILILAMLFSNKVLQGQAFEMSANRSMTRAPAIYREMRDTNWAGLDGPASGWDATSKSANRADRGEYFSAGLLRMTGKTQLCPADYRRHMHHAMQADTGLAQGMYFVDSCCSKTIVKDVRHLKNITLMTTPAKSAGLTGITETQHQADLYMPVKDVRGKQTTIILKGVYFDLNIKYNLISVNELANISYESPFGQRKSSIQGSAGIVPLVHTSNVYELEVMEQGL